MMSLPLLLRLLVGAAYAESPWDAEPAPAGWSAMRAEWKLVIREGAPVLVHGRYVLATPDARGEIVNLVGPELLVTDVSGPVYADERGLELALDPDRRALSQSFSGLYLPDDDGHLRLRTLPATRTHVTVEAPGLDVTIDGAVDGWLTPTDTLSVSWRPHVEGEKPVEAMVAQGEAASVFRAEGGSLLVESTVRWRVVRGEARRLSFATNGLEELDVSGPGVAKWRREGGQIVVEPKAPVTGLFAVTVRGRAPLGKGERSVPTPEPTNVLRVDTYVTMARSDEGELIPVAMPTSVQLGKLPVWAKNLGDGVPLVAWHGPQPVRVLPGAFETVQGPDTVVTQARFTLAAAREGHAALRMNLRVRNERRQYLHLRPAKGWKPVVVRVGNQPVSWLSDGQGGIYVPLEKSVETVKGLLSFPVDIEWLATDQQVWEKRGEMALEVPSLDAPVQSATWEIHLPRGYRALRSPLEGSARMIVTDVRGAEYADDSGAAEAERQRQEVVSSALQNAVSAYKKNDWSTAQQWLDEAKTVDEGNEDAQSLQANLDIIEGRSSQNDLGSRRVKELAKAKTSGLQESQKSVEEEADYSLRAGDLDKAEAKYEEALAVANELQKTEQFESVEQSAKIGDATRKLAEIREQKQQRSSSFGSGSGTSASALGSLGGRGRAGGMPATTPDTVEAPEDRKGDEFGWVETGDDEQSVLLDGLEVSGGEVGGEIGGLLGGVAGGAAYGAEAEPSAGAVSFDDDHLEALGYLDDGDAPAKESARTTMDTTTVTSGKSKGNFGLKASKKMADMEAEEDEELVVVEKSVERKAAPKPDAAGRPMSKAPASPIVSQGSVATGSTVSEIVTKVPSGRSYQSAVSSVAGVAATDPPVFNPYAGQQGASYRPGGPLPGNVSPAKPVVPPTTAYAPPPAPPPPPAVFGYDKDGAGVTEGHEARDQDRRTKREDVGIDTVVDIPVATPEVFDPNGIPFGQALAPDVAATPPADPKLSERPRRVPEKRKPLVASASPMALAMPLDGPTLTVTQALLPAGTFPTFRFLYRELPSENL